MSGVRCFVLVKMNGNNPSKLFVKIIRNSEVTITDFPLFSFPLLRNVFISLCSLFVSRLTAVLFRDGMKFLLGSIVIRWLLLFSLKSTHEGQP